MTSTLRNDLRSPLKSFTNDNLHRPDGLELPWWCDANAYEAPQAYLALRNSAEPTPLVELDGLASVLGVARVTAKDETRRLELGNFKALGGAYAVLRLAQRKACLALRREIAPGQLFDEDVKAAIAGITVCCATDGNHGRSVASGAQLLGLNSVVFLHAGVTKAREDAIASLGAKIVRVAGSYEDSVRHASRTADLKGWTLIADTASERSETREMCGFVMQGYTVMLQEIFAANAPREPFTHVFVQAGVGGLAATIIGHWAARQPNCLPKFIVVEPDRSACLLQSAIAGKLVEVPDDKPTVMAMLECQRPSELAWPIVSRLAHTFIAVSDEDAEDACRVLKRGVGADLPILAGESGAAGLAGLLRCREEAALWNDLQLGSDSSVLVLITEAGRGEGVVA